MTTVSHRLKSGNPDQRGATWDGSGVNFGLFSAHATKVELCLFDKAGKREIERIELPEYTDEVWHGYIRDLRPGQLYGYRVHGPYDPAAGHRFNPHKLLIDPYAKALNGDIQWHDSLFAYKVGGKREDLNMDKRDSAPYLPKCRVIDPNFRWGDEHKPRRKWADTVIYEAHVKGFTYQHPDVPEKMRGTMAGLARPEVVDYLVKLGVTAVELLPVHAFVQDRFLVEKNLRNYWGYNTIGFFAPEASYLSEGEIGEFRACVKTLHEANIEVILDVVYNHTAEGNHLGPTLSFKGIDNASYYRLSPEDPRHYYDTTGCGNTLNLAHPRVLQMVMDSLRYWVTEMHVDGFRFDLASALGRESTNGFDSWGGFFDVIQQDPILTAVKFIAEPWDMGEGGYQVGGFPPGWSEWNDKFRDTIRDYWKGDEGTISDLAKRLSGSADIYNRRGRRPHASVNFITAHDGFCLRDLVSYNEPHNEANQEDSGHGDNKSWNGGEEGDTENPEVLAIRARQQRNFLATLLLSQGVPMLLGGDEFGRTQQGNNNAYCQDSEISWFDWENHDEALFAFTRKLIKLRHEHPTLRRDRFYDCRDIAWWSPNGEEMKDENWSTEFARTLGVLLRHPNDTDLVMLLNAHHEDVEFHLPPEGQDRQWKLVFDTSDDEAEGARYDATQPYIIKARSFALLEETKR